MRLATYLVLSIALTAGLMLFYGRYYSTHQDFAGSLLSAKLAVTLGPQFPDYISYFPPAERIWFTLAVHLADVTGLRLDLAALMMVALAVLISTSMAYEIQRKTVGASPLFLLGSAAVLVVSPILFKNVFGLREHMVALGLWPYLVLRISDPDGTKVGRGLRIAVGAWLGVMLLAKYLYAVIVALVELADALLHRRVMSLFRVENLVSGGIVGLYLFSWLGLDAHQREVIGAMTSAIDANLVDRTTSLKEAANGLYFSLFFFVARRMFSIPGRVNAIGFAVVLGAVLVAAAQGRWYSHHLYPIYMAYVLWWWMAARGFKWWGHLVVIAFLFVPTVTQLRSTASYQGAVTELSGALARQHASLQGKKVGILTMHPSPYNQVIAMDGGSRWNALMNNSYVSAELKPFDRRENAQVPPPPVTLDDPGRRLLHDEMIRLWEDQPPDILILDHSYRWPLRYLDVEWRHVFSKDARFNAIMSHYRPVFSHRGDHVRFVYYVRAD